MNFTAPDFGLNLNFDFGFGTNDVEDEPDDGQASEKEYIRAAHLPHKPVCYKNAQDMVAGLDIRQDYFCMVSGSFIFGDFLEALIDRHKFIVQRMYVSTLGMSEDNVDSLVNLVKYLHVQELNLIVSGYFVGVERHGLIPYLAKEFAGLPIRVAVVASHAKITLIDFGALRIVIHGSANLSSSRNLETFYFTHDPAVFSFVENIYKNIMERWTIIDGPTGTSMLGNHKDNTSQKLWRQVVEFSKEAATWPKGAEQIPAEPEEAETKKDQPPSPGGTIMQARRTTETNM